MAKQNPNKSQQDGHKSQPIGNYNPGGQAGESVQGGGQRPAGEPGGPFLGKSAGNLKRDNPPPGSANPGQTGTPGGKGKQDAPQNQKR
jgi:hypothetical protein